MDLLKSDRMLPFGGRHPHFGWACEVGWWGGREAYNKSDDGNIDYNVYSSSVVRLFFSSGAAGGCIHIDR